MNHARVLSFAILFVLAFAGRALCDSGHEHKEGDPTKLGKVHFPIACGPESQKKFDVALAMLHSFWYSRAERAFSDLAAADPGCAMAHWGVAMSHFHQIWEQASSKGLSPESWASSVRREPRKRASGSQSGQQGTSV